MAPDTPEDSIKRVLNEVSRAKRNRQDHVILSELSKWEAVAKQLRDEPDKRVDLVR